MLDLYYTMLRIRRAQEALMREYHPADEMRCPVHFCVGQEAPPAGICLNLRAEDYMFTGHRSHGFYLAKGGSLKGLFAELYGKATGSNGGKAGSQEISDEDANFYSGTILAGHLPIAAGAALASQMRGDGRVTIAALGDGSADEGLVYETLNLAALWSLPMVFICENNRFSGFSRQEARQALCDLAGRARAFGLPARRLDGNDAMTVSRAAKRAIDRARNGSGPSFLELDTYRWCPHVGPEDDDHFEYRSPDELRAWMDRCPIEGIKNSLLERGILNETLEASLERRVADEIEDAFAFAKTSPFPEPDALMRDVFAENQPENGIAVKDFRGPTFDFRQPETVLRPY
jgi:pyruvate dehydrogenase E1 component alpha subunit